jgi:hypothetical protein
MVIRYNEQVFSAETDTQGDGSRPVVQLPDSDQSSFMNNEAGAIGPTRRLLRQDLH